MIMLSLWTTIALFYRLANAQLPDQGNAIEFPPSFGMAGGLLSGMLGFVDIFDPILHSPTPSPGIASTDPPSSLPGSITTGQAPISSTELVNLSTDVANTLSPSRRSPPSFDISTPVVNTEKPKPRDPFFVDMSLLQKIQSTGALGADSSHSVHMNVTANNFNSAGQSSGTDANNRTGFSGSGGSGDPLIHLFGGLSAQRHDSQVTALVNATTTKATTTAKLPVLPTTSASNQQILQMLNSFSNQRVVLGKSQGKSEGQNKNNIPPGLNKDHGPTQIGDKKSGNTGNSQSHGRAAGKTG